MIDYARIFEVATVPLALFNAKDYCILAANDFFLDAVGAGRSDVVGKRFDVAFPASPDDPKSADNVEQLRASLDRVRRSGCVDSIPAQRYPVPVRDADESKFEERFWNIINSPVFDEEGNVEAVLNRVEDVTEAINKRRVCGEASRNLQNVEAGAARMEAQILRHVEDVQRLNHHLSLAQRVANVGSWQLNIKDGTRSWSDQMYRILGLNREEGEVDFEKISNVVHPEDRESFFAERRRFLSGEGLPGEFEHRIIRPDNGEVRYVRERAEAVYDRQNDVECLFGTLQDVTAYHLIESKLTTRAQQQRAVAELGKMALKDVDLFKVYDTAVSTIAETLDVEYCKVLKLLPDEPLLELIAGAGWREGLVGEAKVDTGGDSQAGYTLQSDEPVIVEDLRTDRRFNGPPLLQQHGVVSGVSVIIHGENGPWGVLGAHTKARRRFDKDDVSFVQSVANIIGEANRRARTEQALRRNETRTRKIIDSALDAVIAIDSDSQILEWNPQAEALFGWRCEEVFGKRMYELIVPEELREMHIKGMRHFMETGEGPLLDRRTEVPALHRDGHRIPVELSIAAVRADGDVQFNAFLRDISERKIWETRMQESEERFRMVARATADTIWDWNLQTDNVWWNEGIETVFGYRRTDVEPDSRSFRTRIHPEDIEKFDRFICSATEGDDDEWSAEYRFRKTDGSYAIVNVRAYLIRDEQGQPVRMVGGMNDVSEAREREKRLEQQAALLDKAQDAIIVSDIAGNITFWNKGAERLYAWRAEEVLGHSKRELLEEDPHIFDGGMKQTIKTGEWSGVLEQKRKDGSTFTVQSVLSLVTDEHNQPVRVLCINTDISERLALEEQLRQSQRLEAVGQLTGGIAHDFNNLLTVILGNAELMAEQLPENETLHRLAIMTRDAATRGSDLTHGLLAFARRQALEPRSVDVDQLVGSMEALLKRALPENINIEISNSGDDQRNAFVDPAQLESVLLNLALNAKDAMPEGGRLTIETDNVELDEDYAAHHAEVAPGRYVMLAVSDSGTGIPQDVVNHVFDPFFTTKEQGKGTGLGLSMAYGFAKQSGGHIKIYTEAGEGTTVKVYLPRAGQPEGALDAGGEKQPDATSGEKILVVEDDDLVRVHAESQLEVIGYEVRSASNGPEALKILEAEPDVDLLFTDVIMSGGLNGPELVELARRFRPKLKVLYTSGYTENAIVHHGRLDEGVQLLQKPYRRNELAQKVRAVLSQPVYKA